MLRRPPSAPPPDTLFPYPTLFRSFRDRLLSVDDAIVYLLVAISCELKRRTGQAPPVIDTLLAATAIEHDLFLVTRNIKDIRHSGAVIFNPWEIESASWRESVCQYV